MNTQLLKLSAKYVFKKLREKAPYSSYVLNDKVFVNRLFWNHLNFSKERTREETEERLLLIPFLEEVLQKGIKISENSQFIRIEKSIGNFQVGVVIVKNNQKKILLSMFLVHKKNDLPPA